MQYNIFTEDWLRSHGFAHNLRL